MKIIISILLSFGMYFPQYLFSQCITEHIFERSMSAYSGGQIFIAPCDGIMSSISFRTIWNEATSVDIDIRNSDCEIIRTIENVNLAEYAIITIDLLTNDSPSIIVEENNQYSFHFTNPNGRLNLMGNSANTNRTGAIECMPDGSTGLWHKVTIESTTENSWNQSSSNCFSINNETGVVKKIDGGNYWNCALTSSKYLPQNEEGALRMKINKTNQVVMIGLSEERSYEELDSINFGIGLQQASIAFEESTYNRMQLNIFEKGSIKGKKYIVYKNDEISIHKYYDGSISYKVNDIEIYKSKHSRNKCLVVDCNLKTMSAELSRIRLEGNWIEGECN